MSFEEIRIIFVVYTSALFPIFIISLYRKNPFQLSLIKLYIVCFLLCSLGWELWFTYGWFDGDPVDERRSHALNLAIPKHINWLMNSMGDAGTICIGGLWLTWFFSGRNLSIFETWNWKAFFILLAWCLGQNICVEMFLYFDQLSIEKQLSWAPLAPTGPWINPQLFYFNERTIMLQSQIPWVIMTPILYWLAIQTFKNNKINLLSHREQSDAHQNQEMKTR
ncbi:MAG: hypothetical protein HOM10_02780 [Gammaproteobacteria bacterium]|jgi:hypothetical protein|nr:hypothetical protein [Gammaproteobacteria bacterium]